MTRRPRASIRTPHHPRCSGGTGCPGGLTQPAPSPRFSRTPGQLSDPPAAAGQHTTEALTEWGLADAADLVSCGAAVQA